MERLLEEKKTFDLSLQFEKLGTEEEALGWKEPGQSNVHIWYHFAKCRPAPSSAHPIDALPTSSNLLTTTVESFVTTEYGKNSAITNCSR